VARIDPSAAEKGIQMPVSADGHWWWYLVGQGWAAADWLAFHAEAEAPYPPRPEMAGTGIIAYLGTDSQIWAVNADGSSPRLFHARSSETEYFDALRWSPSGKSLAFTVRRTTPDGQSGVFTRIVNESGAVVTELSGLSEATWSPDGTRISAVQVSSQGEMGGFYGTPVVYDLNRGVVTPLGVPNFYMNAPTWNPDGSSLAFVCVSSYSSQPQADGSMLEVRRECGGDGLRVVTADGGEFRVLLPDTAEDSVYYSNPTWAPSGDRIALASRSDGGSGCSGFVTVSVQTGTVIGCFSTPAPSGLGGGCGGSSEMDASDWSADGRYLAYHYRLGAGRNGVFIVDTVTGQSRLIPTSDAAFVTISGDGSHVVFGGSQHIWLADANGSAVTMLGRGDAPAWQPR
jgi:Tol biopolymer transport system component